MENRRLRRRDACLSRAGIELARHRAAQLGLQARASFAAADITATGVFLANLPNVRYILAVAHRPAHAPR